MMRAQIMDEITFTEDDREYLKRVGQKVGNIQICPKCGKWITDERRDVADVLFEQHLKKHEKG